MTLRQLIDKAFSIGRQISSAEIPAYVNSVDKIEGIELSQTNDGKIYANINTKKSKRQISAKAKEALLNKALDFILEREESNDYICEILLSIPDEGNYCENNCQNLKKECVKRFLKHYENNQV